MLTAEEDADDRARAILAHLQAEAYNQGICVINHDCRIELFDYVRVQDGR